MTRVGPGAFRLFLALVVLVSHSCRFDLGNWAVLMFFTLSGFWIHRMWAQKYSHARAPAAAFLVSRSLRLLPVFWLANLIATAVQAALGPSLLSTSPLPVGWPAALVPNALILGYACLPKSLGALVPAWSLDIEVQFYLAFALLMAVFARGSSKRVWIWTAAAASGLALFLYLRDTGEDAPRSVATYGLLFLAGAVASGTGWRPSRGLVTASLVATLALVAACALSPSLRPLVENMKHGATVEDQPAKRAFQFALALLAAPLALQTVRNPSRPGDRLLSEVTFILYLIQWPVMRIHSRFFEHLPPLQRLPSILAAWAAIALLTVVVFRYYDQPLERMRRRWMASRFGV